MKKILFVILNIILVFSFILLNCKKKHSSDKKVITVSILPQKYFVERISGNNFDINVMVRPGFSPHDYEPLPEQMKKVSESVLYLKIDVPFEKIWIDKIYDLNPETKIIDTNKGIILRNFQTVKNNAKAENTYEEKDPHVWLSPSLVKIQADNIYKAIIDLDPENHEIYKNNYENFLIDLDNLSNKIKTSFSKINTKKIMVFHPSWGYFTDEFGLTQIPIEIQGKEPTPKQLVKIINTAKEQNIKVIFVQKQFSKQSAEAIAEEIGAIVISIDPLSENYIENLNNISKTIINSIE